ncbi:MAG: Flp pilus assembly complex ATPase component TadA [Deltaproteobacteria bacterium]|nr:Flp pilus assembly complex ATPase component TadA [Deltaproteobacteria bacterium]
MLEIIVTGNNKQEKKYLFAKRSIMIGRAEGNDVALDSEDVSRYHARLSVINDEVIVQDLDSTNGVYVRAQEVKEAVVTENEIIRIGEFAFKVKYIEDEEESAELDFSTTTEANQPKVDNKKQNAGTLTSVESSVKQQADEGNSEIQQFYWESLKAFLGPVWDLINDESITEILINGQSHVYIEQKGKLHKTDIYFTNDQLQAAVINIAQFIGRRVSEEDPILDARLPDGSRVGVILPPCSRNGVSISIRKFAKEKLTLEKLLSFKSISEEMLIFLKACVALRKNIIISGGTSSGKTSLLNVVSSLIPDDERILTIEDSAELQLMQDHVLSLETRPADKKGRGEITIRDLVKASLRMRPDRIIVGEIRGGEALDLLQAMNTGHSGSMATLHASSPAQALSRLETLSLFSGLELPLRALREQVSSAIDVIVQAARLPDHSRKVTNIAVVNQLADDGSYQVFDIFRYRAQGGGGGGHFRTSHIPEFIEECEIAGLNDVIDLFKK